MVKNPASNVLVNHVIMGLPPMHLTFWLLRNFYWTDKGSVPHSVNRGILYDCSKSLAAMFGSMGLAGVFKGFTIHCHFCPRISWYFASFLGLGWLCIKLPYVSYFSFLELHCFHKSRGHAIISRLMHHFYLQHPSTCKCFDPCDIDHSLSLLESWAPASSITNFKLAWKTAALLPHVSAKCSDLALL